MRCVFELKVGATACSFLRLLLTSFQRHFTSANWQYFTCHGVCPWRPGSDHVSPPFHGEPECDGVRACRGDKPTDLHPYGWRSEEVANQPTALLIDWYPMIKNRAVACSVACVNGNNKRVVWAVGLLWTSRCGTRLLLNQQRQRRRRRQLNMTHVHLTFITEFL